MLRLSLTFLLAVLTNHHASANIVNSKLYTRSWQLPKEGSRTFVPGTLYATDVNTFPYATCEFTKPNMERVCNVTLVNPNKQVDSGTCRVKIVTNSEDKELFYNGYFHIIPFAQNQVAVVWYVQTKEPKNATEKKYDFNIRILNMTTCAASDLLNFPIEKVDYGFFPALVTYNRQIDVVVNSLKACVTANRCKLSFDLHGKQIGNAQPYKPKYSQYASAVSPAFPAKGFFQTVKVLSGGKVILVNTTGGGTEVWNVKYEEQKHAIQDAYGSFSNAYELYSLCWTPAIGTKKPTKISCSQFDSTGNVKMSKEMIFPQLLHWITVHNLPSGGLLLATDSCDKVESGKCDTIHIHKINALGKEKLHKFHVPDIECHDITSDLAVRISENDSDEVCFDFSCLSSPTKLNYVSKCVDKLKLY